MTIQEMHTRFKIYIDKIDTFSMPDITHSEIDVFLNKAQLELIKAKYGGNNQFRTGTEEVEKRREDLANITKDYNVAVSTIASTSANKPNGKFVPWVSDFMFALAEEVSIDVDEFGNKITVPRRVNLKPITHDIYSQVIKDPFNKPDPSVCVKLTYNQSIEIIAGNGINVLTYYLRYIAEPRLMVYTDATTPMDIVNKINVSCELMDQIHEELLDRAVSLALEALESPRFQTQSINSLKNE